MGLTRVVLGFFCVSLLIVAPRVTAQTTVTLNENGTATAVTAGPGGGTVNYTGVNQQDPGPGGLPNALVFDVGTSPLLAAGDVLLYDPTTLALTDLIRFNDINGVDQIVFYAQDGTGSKADTGFPSAVQGNNRIDMFENPNGPTVYMPGDGEPGFISFGALTYVINTATAVPEPSTLVLLNLSAAVFLAVMIHRRRKA